MKVAEQTKIKRYISYARIYVYIDLSKHLLEVIRLNWEDEEWTQPLDYEQFRFQCRLYHEYGHFGRNCPKNSPISPNPTSQEGGNDKECFRQVRNKKKNIVLDHQKKGKEKGKGLLVSKNPFHILE